MQTQTQNIIGNLHPITIAIDNIARIFTRLGFDIVDGPEMESEWYNFDALNVPKYHPSRDMQDTFFIKDKSVIDVNDNRSKMVLRTHTSGMQIRSMMSHVKSNAEYPLAVVIPGKVYRNEATDATHEAQFFQVEMLYVGVDASMAMLKGIMEKFFSEFFDKELKVRLRSSFFPFTEPSCEFDVQCIYCIGAGCTICKQTGWIEIGGAGVVHPNVLTAGNIDNKKYKGISFGCGIDRMMMLKYAYDDIRLFYNGDMRVIEQFHCV